MSTDIKHPEITVKLVDEDGNAFAILGLDPRALRRAGVSSKEIKQFTEEATGGDYDHLLRTVMRWVDTE